MRYSLLIATTLLLLTISRFAYPNANTTRVRAIFQGCVACHGALFNILDVKDLVAKNIVQGQENSTLYKALTRAVNWMPKGKDPLPFEDKQAVLQWLVEGYPPFDELPPTVIKPLDENQISRCFRQDAFNGNQQIAKNFLYVQLANYYGTGPDDLSRLQEAVNKLFNQVSLSEISIGRPVACEGNPIAGMRFDLRDINQTRVAADDIIVVGQYPYFIDRRGIEGFEEAVENQKDILRITQSRTVPYIRADWLIETASRDPVYSNLLFHGVNVRDINDFERKFLRVNTQKLLLETEEAKVAIFRRSGVTLYNREVHEYPIDFFGANGIGYHLSYWKTFDVVNDIANRNFFAFPFGPFYDFYEKNFKFLENKAFINDATEIIVTGLPGGQFFSLFAGIAQKNVAIKEADTQVAQQTENTIHPILGAGRAQFGFTGKSGAILNGQSCNSCHSGSMNAFIDEGRGHLDLSTDFSNEQINFAHRSFYENQGQIDAHIKAANAAWASSMKLMGAKQTSYPPAQEPIFATSKAYLQDLDVCQFGLELGFVCNDIKNALSHAPDLARKLGLSETFSGRASRLNVEALQAQIAIDLNLGRAVIFKKGTEPPPPPPPICHLRITNKTEYPQKFEKLTFEKTSSYGPYYLNPGQVQDFEHDSDAILDACLFFESNRCIVTHGLRLKKCGTYEIRKREDGYSQFFEGVRATPRG